MWPLTPRYFEILTPKFPKKKFIGTEIILTIRFFLSIYFIKFSWRWQIENNEFIFSQFLIEVFRVNERKVWKYFSRSQKLNILSKLFSVLESWLRSRSSKTTRDSEIPDVMTNEFRVEISLNPKLSKFFSAAKTNFEILRKFRSASDFRSEIIWKYILTISDLRKSESYSVEIS